MNPAPATTSGVAGATPRIEYLQLSPGQASPTDTLFAVGFGAGSAPAPFGIRVPLEPLSGQDLVEIWRATGEIHRGESDGIRFSNDDHFLAGVLEVAESEHRDLAEATAFAYRAIAGFQAASAFPHVLRTWNYFDAINLGAGEDERYRGFCSGRVAGLERLRQAQHPAATVIGRRDGHRVLQVYWLAGRLPGVALENPRQVSAYLYPRQYGETSPTFSRAMLVAQRLLMVSGTASIVGHTSRHRDDTRAQVREIIANLDALLARAHAQAPALPAQLGRHTLIKAYLKNRGDLALVEELLRERLPAESPLLVLQGDVCRAELLVEFDCIQGPAEPGS